MINSIPNIRYLLVYPKNQHRARYFVNENTKDTHSLNYNDMYKFICTLIEAPAIVHAAEYLQTFQPFIVDVEDNKVVKLTFNRQAMIEEQLKDLRKIDFSKVYKQAMEQKREDPILNGGINPQSTQEKKVVPFQKNVENLVKKLTE